MPPSSTPARVTRCQSLPPWHFEEEVVIEPFPYARLPQHIKLLVLEHAIAPDVPLVIGRPNHKDQYLKDAMSVFLAGNTELYHAALSIFYASVGINLCLFHAAGIDFFTNPLKARLRSIARTIRIHFTIADNLADWETTIPTALNEMRTTGALRHLSVWMGTRVPSHTPSQDPSDTELLARTFPVALLRLRSSALPSTLSHFVFHRSGLSIIAPAFLASAGFQSLLAILADDVWQTRVLRGVAVEGWDHLACWDCLRPGERGEWHRREVFGKERSAGALDMVGEDELPFVRLDPMMLVRFFTGARVMVVSDKEKVRLLDDDYVSVEEEEAPESCTPLAVDMEVDIPVVQEHPYDTGSSPITYPSSAVDAGFSVSSPADSDSDDPDDLKPDDTERDLWAVYPVPLDLGGVHSLDTTMRAVAECPVRQKDATSSLHQSDGEESDDLSFVKAMNKRGNFGELPPDAIIPCVGSSPPLADYSSSEDEEIPLVTLGISPVDELPIKTHPWSEDESSLSDDTESIQEDRLDKDILQKDIVTEITLHEDMSDLEESATKVAGILATFQYARDELASQPVAKVQPPPDDSTLLPVQSSVDISNQSQAPDYEDVVFSFEREASFSVEPTPPRDNTGADHRKLESLITPSSNHDSENDDEVPMRVLVQQTLNPSAHEALVKVPPVLRPTRRSSLNFVSSPDDDSITPSSEDEAVPSRTMISTPKKRSPMRLTASSKTASVNEEPTGPKMLEFPQPTFASKRKAPTGLSDPTLNSGLPEWLAAPGNYKLFNSKTLLGRDDGPSADASPKKRKTSPYVLLEEENEGTTSRQQTNSTPAQGLQMTGLSRSQRRRRRRSKKHV